MSSVERSVRVNYIISGAVRILKTAATPQDESEALMSKINTEQAIVDRHAALVDAERGSPSSEKVAAEMVEYRRKRRQ